MSKLKVGMISFAHAGHPDNYLKALIAHKGVEVVGIAHEDKSRIQRYLNDYQISHYSNYQELLQTECDAVFICSEYIHHAELTIEAAKHGKHIMCEKPLGLTVNEMRKMISVCRENNVQLMTAFPSRYFASIIDAKEAINRGDIGEVIAVKGTNRGEMPGQWFVNPSLSGGGAIMDHTVHIMDVLNWILNTPVHEVYAISDTLFYDLEVEDSGMVHVKFENGTKAVIDTSWSRSKTFPASFDVMLDFIGTKGTISIDALGQYNELYSDNSNKTQWTNWGDNMDKHLVNDFVNALLGDRKVPITGEDGLKATEVVLAAYESIKRNEPIFMNR